MNRFKLSKLSDRELVDAVIQGDESAIGYFFYVKFNALFSRNFYKVAANKNVVLDDLVQDLFVHLSKNDWENLRKYDEDCGQLVNWLSVVSYYFFRDKTASMIDSAPKDTIDDLEERSIFLESSYETDTDMTMMDIKKGMENLRPPRDRDVIEYLVVQGRPPEEVAKELGVTKENLYNIKSRALVKLRKWLYDERMKEEEETGKSKKRKKDKMKYSKKKSKDGNKKSE